MKKLEQVLGKRVLKKEPPRHSHSAGRPLGRSWIYFIGHFFMAEAPSPRPRPGCSGRHTFIPAALRARRISAQPMALQIGGLPHRALSPQGCQLGCHYQSNFVPAICFYNSTMCGRSYDYDGTNCGSVYLPDVLWPAIARKSDML